MLRPMEKKGLSAVVEEGMLRRNRDNLGLLISQACGQLNYKRLLEIMHACIFLFQLYFFPLEFICMKQSTAVIT